MTIDGDINYMVTMLAAECERAAGWIRRFDENPELLRAWAARVENKSPLEHAGLYAKSLENAACEARRFIAAVAQAKHA